MPHKVAVCHRNEGEGKGALFDHFTLKQMTGAETEICAEDSSLTQDFEAYLKEQPKYQDAMGYYPQFSGNHGKEALFLFIPGYTRDSDNNKSSTHVARIAYEKKLIEKARTRGQPILAVCAGSWTLLEYFGGTTIPVSDHNYGGAMPRLSKQKPEVCNNKMIHRIQALKQTILAGIIGSEAQPQVNSVHWKAAEPIQLSSHPLLEVSAISVQDNTIAPRNRQASLMQPDTSVEAFETKYGTPTIGVQWHPEAFSSKDPDYKAQKALFNYIFQAGLTYLNRLNLNQEFLEKHAHQQLPPIQENQNQSSNRKVVKKKVPSTKERRVCISSKRKKKMGVYKPKTNPLRCIPKVKIKKKAAPIRRVCELKDYLKIRNKAPSSLRTAKKRAIQKQHTFFRYKDHFTPQEKHFAEMLEASEQGHTSSNKQNFQR